MLIVLGFLSLLVFRGIIKLTKFTICNTPIQSIPHNRNKPNLQKNFMQLPFLLNSFGTSFA